MNKFALALTLLTAPACWARGWRWTNIMGSKALVVVDGSTPRHQPRAKVQGCRLIAAKGDSAVVEVDGQRQRCAWVRRPLRCRAVAGRQRQPYRAGSGQWRAFLYAGANQRASGADGGGHRRHRGVAQCAMRTS